MEGWKTRKDRGEGDRKTGGLEDRRDERQEDWSEGWRTGGLERWRDRGQIDHWGGGLEGSGQERCTDGGLEG